MRKMKIRKLLLSLFLIPLLFIFPSNVSAEFFRDLIVTSPDGIWTDERAYSSLKNAISAVGSSNRTIVVASEEIVTDLTIPSNVSLDFKRGGKITYSGQLTINTTNISAPDQPIFNPTGSGEADFARGTELRSAWFNNLNEMFDQTVDDYVTIVINSGWAASIIADATVGDNVTLKWEGPGQWIDINSGFTLSNVRNISAGSYRIFGGSGDIDFKTGSVLRTSWFGSFRSAVSYIDDEDVDLTLIVDGVCTVDTNTSVDQYINLQFENGALLSPAAGVTVTIYSPESIIAGKRQQIFDTTNNSDPIDFSLGGTIYPDWWGANADDNSLSASTNATAIQAAIHSAEDAGQGLIKFNQGTYYFDNQLQIDGDFIRLKGEGSSLTILKSTYAGVAIYFNTTAPLQDSAGTPNLLGNAVDGLTLEGDGSTTTIGIRMVHCVNENPHIRDVFVTKFTDAQIELDNCWMARVSNARIGRNAVGDYGIRIYNANNVLIDHSIISLMAAGATAIYATDAEGFVVRDSDIESVNKAVVVTDGFGPFVFEGNYLESATGSDPIAVTLGSSSDLETAYIEANKIAWGGGTGTAVAISTDNVKHVYIDNNWFGTVDYEVRTTANTEQVFWGENQYEISDGLMAFDDVGDALVFPFHGDSVYIPAHNFIGSEGTPSLTSVGTGINRVEAWELPDAATTSIVASVVLPLSWRRFGDRYDIYVIVEYFTATAGSDTVYMSARGRGVAVGEDVRTGYASYKSFPESTVDYGRMSQQLSVVYLWDENDLVNIAIKRLGADANDTSTQSVYIIGVRLVLNRIKIGLGMFGY